MSDTNFTMNFSADSPLLLVSLLVATFVLTLPFGVWRARCTKFTFQWWLAIHLIIPVIILMRVWAGFSYAYVPLFILATVLGQLVGGRFRKV
ncbi:hypothetical protein EP232_02380 [bacterium]|nr:MAG: hypothetical protein EP232_02380 [bacterium]